MKGKYLIAVGLLIGAPTAGCVACGDDPSMTRYEYFPDMVDSIPYDAYAKNPITRDGKTLMAPPPGTVARGARPFRYGPGPGEAARAGKELTNPVEPTPETLARGAKAFQTWCAPCHGIEGLGDGPMIPSFSKPPSLVAEHAKSLPDGQIFHIITRGQGVMPAHGAQVLPEDRWKIVHHIRSLSDKPAAQGAAQ